MKPASTGLTKSVIITVVIELMPDETELKAPQYAPAMYKPATLSQG